MIKFPKNGSNPIKVEPFGNVRWCLRLWVQRKELIIPCLIVLALKLFGFITRTIFILHSLNNLDVLLEVSAIYSIPLLAVAKMIFLFWKRRNTKFVFTAIEKLFWDKDVAGNKVKTYLEKRFRFINFLLLGHLTTSIFYVILHLLFAEVPIPEGHTRWLPTLISVPFNTDKSPIYEFLYLILSWNMFISVFGNGFYDILFVYSCQHLTGQFMLLKNLLRHLDYGLMNNYNDFEKFKSQKFQQKIRDRIAICVEHHNLLIRFGDELKDLTSIIFGIQLITTLLTLVLTGYTLTQNLEELTKSTMLLSFVFSSTVQFSIFAIQSADISEQSASVADTAYQSNWYLFDAKSKRGLSLLIMNSQQGISMYGAGLVEINNEVIVTMGQKVFSFITLLESLDEQN